VLVLTRKANQQIAIGDDVTITVVKIQGNSVRLGIVAPGDRSIRRSELPARSQWQVDVPLIGASQVVAPQLPSPPKADAPAESPIVLAGEAEFQIAPPHRVLIVDDNPEDRATYRRLMSADRVGEYVVTESESGEEGLRLCKNEMPDCVLLDYRLPDLSGLEFLAELARDEAACRVPVVMLTGHGDEMVAVEAMKGGAQDYLVKRYITGERLQSAVYNAMARGLLRSSVRTVC
jgi:carbon storage regulator CsrA